LFTSGGFGLDLVSSGLGLGLTSETTTSIILSSNGGYDLTGTLHVL